MCGAVEGLPREGEGQQDLGGLAPFVWEQSLDISISELGSGSGAESEQGTNVGTLSWLARPEPQCVGGC